MNMAILSYEARCKIYEQEVQGELRKGLEMLHTSMLTSLKEATEKAALYDSLGGRPQATPPPLHPSLV